MQRHGSHREPQPALAAEEAIEIEIEHGEDYEQNGGMFQGERYMYEADMPVETCALCHGEGRTADVMEVHGL